MATINVDTLIPRLRLRIGDTDPTNYRYLDSWLSVTLVESIRVLSRRWNNRYLVSDTGDVSRNSGIPFNLDSSYGVIQPGDDSIIVLQAVIILLEGSLETSAWSAVSWRDNEVSFSNLEQFRSRDTNLKRLIDELDSAIKPAGKRLAWTQGYPLPGFKDNTFENNNKP